MGGLAGLARYFRGELCAVLVTPARRRGETCQRLAGHPAVGSAPLRWVLLRDEWSAPLVVAAMWSAAPPRLAAFRSCMFRVLRYRALWLLLFRTLSCGLACGLRPRSASPA